MGALRGGLLIEEGRSSLAGTDLRVLCGGLYVEGAEQCFETGKALVV